MTSVIVFGPTGQIGSVVARAAGEHGAKVWLAMRDTSKSIPGLTKESEKAGNFSRIQADLQKPETVTEAVKTSGAKRAFIYLIHASTDHLRGAIEAMKSAGIEFVVFLSSFTIYLNQNLRNIDPSDLLAYLHGQVEANLEDVFGPENYVAVRSGCFITNLLSEKSGIAAGKVHLYGGVFEQDNIAPSDVGKTIGAILVSGPRNGKRKVYIYGPEIRSINESIDAIGKVLGKDLEMSAMGAKEGYDNYISLGMPPAYAEFMVNTLATEGPDKGNGERYPFHQEGVNNVKLYTGQPPITLEAWVKDNRAIFDIE